MSIESCRANPSCNEITHLKIQTIPTATNDAAPPHRRTAPDRDGDWVTAQSISEK